MDALALFRGDWFLRNEQMSALTGAEQVLVRTALGPRRNAGMGRRTSLGWRQSWQTAQGRWNTSAATC